MRMDNNSDRDTDNESDRNVLEDEDQGVPPHVFYLGPNKLFGEMSLFTGQHFESR